MRDIFPFHVSTWVHSANDIPLLPLHSHDFIEIVFVISGSATHIFHSEQFGMMEYKIFPGDIFIINPHEMHTYRLDSGESVEVTNLQFFPTIIDWPMLRVPECAQLMDFFYVQPFLGADARFTSILKLSPTETEEVKTMVRKIEQEFHSKLPGYTSLIKLMLTELILRLSRYYAVNPKMNRKSGKFIDGISSVEEQMYKRIIGFLERHYHTLITLEDLAKIAACSTRQVTRIFKQMSDTTMVNYLHNLRVEKSKQLLLSTNDKVSSISAEVGFNDVSFFNRVFKKMTGYSPSEFRKKHE
ncbi:AraC family transcriptional regulator [Paenibacillus sp. J5C2022]|uniref:AraC family transcriptional regulator n=1 Tax=Paenibacillus sp. J5C2022 TaxID=2977129 RepID=UPI0021D2871F|nr:AraC family transcriptional regulator [Paenibacillus sp. J5C2022]